MATTERTVRRLRLHAHSEAAARRIVPVLEDALRCASLPGEGGGLLVVRRLALGRILAGISAQALSLRIEQRTARAAGEWVEGGDARAEGAACVAFAGALQARTLLSARLLRGEACGAWYWPAAVPEFGPRLDAPTNLRRIAQAIAAGPQAPVALPAWAAALAREGGAPALAACFTVQEGRALVERAGLGAAPAWDAGDVLVAAPAAGAQPARAAPAPGMPSAPVPRWLQVLLAVAGFGGSGPSQDAPVTARRQGAPRFLPAAQYPQAEGPGSGNAPRAPGLLPPSTPAAGVERPPPTPPQAAALAGVAPPGRDAQPRARQGGVTPRGERPGTPAPDPAPPARAAPPRDMGQGRERATRHPWLQPTACGGLLFLLPVLQRLGLPAWLPPEDSAFAARVLHAALQRLRVPGDDPAWQLAAAAPLFDDPALALPAPSAWSRPLLAAPRGRVDLAARLRAAGTAQAQAAVWLAAARCWLRRGGGIGVASLVLRPAHLACSATHVDLHFALAATDVRVRRLGLDLDCGWLPWYGRVVAFHYERGLQ